jgi:hypothetical protein
MSQATRTIELADDLVEFALQRCDADIALGLNAVEQSTLRLNRPACETYMRYVVMVRRLKAALEKAA